MAVDYGAGASSAMAAQYADLRNAISSRDDARNRREARDIESKGLFGTGIKSSDVQDFGNIAIQGAQLGEARMGRKMDRATKSFDRRMAADERRVKTLQQRWKTADPDSRAQIMGEIEGIEMGMNEKRNSFEDYMGKYQEKGLWGTKFGGDDVGYRTEGESKWSQAVKEKLTPGGGSGGGSGPKEFTDVRDLGDFDRSPSQPGTDQEFRGGSNIGIGNEPNEYEEKFGGEAYLEDDITRSPSQPGGQEFRGGTEIGENAPGIMNLGGIEAKDQTSPSMTPHRRFPSYMEQGGIEAEDQTSPPMTPHRRFPSYMEQFPKKKDDLVDTSGGPPGRDNYRRALPDALAQAGLSAEERAAHDAAEKQELIKEKYLVGQKKKEYGDQMKNLLAKRKTNKLKDLVSSTFRN